MEVYRSRIHDPALERYVRSLEATVEEQAATIEYLEGEIRDYTDAGAAVKLQHRWRLSPKEAEALLVLFRHRTGTASRDRIYLDMYDDPVAGPDPKIVDVFMNRLRGKLPEGSIINIFGKGFTLAPAFGEEVAAALQLPMHLLKPEPTLGERKPPARRITRKERVLRELRDGKQIASEIAAAMDDEKRRVREVLSTLVTEGLAVRVGFADQRFAGPGPGSTARVYAISEQGSALLDQWDDYDKARDA